MESHGRENRQVNKKLVFVLIVILLLIRATPQRSDHAKNVLGAVDMFSLVAMKNPTPEKIQETIGFESGPRRESVSGGYELSFNWRDAEVQYKFYIFDGKIKWMTSHEQYGLPRGVPYESLEREYVKTMTRRFGYAPKISDVEGISRPNLKITSFEWNNIKMTVHYEKLWSARRPISYLIWKKREEIAVFVTYFIDREE
jgi:hypothetical protein